MRATLPIVMAWMLGGVWVSAPGPQRDPRRRADRGGAILLVSALSLATRQVFSVALYRYASGAPDTAVSPPPISKNRSAAAATADDTSGLLARLV